MKTIIVSGFGWSGSGAVYDYLSLNSAFYSFPVEYRTIKDPGGIIDLENSIFSRGEHLHIDYALRLFVDLCKMHSSKNGKLSRIGLSYAGKINQNFLEISEQFVRSIVDYEYKGHWWHLSINEAYIAYIFRKFLRRMNLGGLSNMRASLVTQDQFEEAVRLFHRNIFSKVPENNFLLLDQALNPWEGDYLERYFDNAKMIVVDRSPIDIYADLVRNKAYFCADPELSVESRALKYVKFYRGLRNKFSECSMRNVLKVDFEDLILRNASEKIEKFLGVSLCSINQTGDNFDRRKSMANINNFNGITLNEINIIRENLT